MKDRDDLIVAATMRENWLRAIDEFHSLHIKLM